MKRRKFLKSLATVTAGLSLTGLYAWQVEPFWLEFVELEMGLKHLPDHMVGKRVLHISDVHVGNKFDYNFLIKSFKKAQKLNPDFVFYTGDFVNYENSKQFPQLEEVFEHAVLGKIGTYGVLGNHDYGHNWKQEKVAQKVSSILRKNGVQILRNQKVEHKGLTICGVDDKWGTNFNPKKAFGLVENTKCNIVLCHNPDVADYAAAKNFKGWMLSGHTHGGQCKPPFLPPPILPVKNERYTAGKFVLDNNRTLYINRALGHLFQVRFNVRPEITVFTLNKAV